METIKMRLLVVYVMCIIHGLTYAQPSISISLAKQVFNEQISDLDPVEGIYDVQNEVIVSSPNYGNNSYKQHFTWVIIDYTRVWVPKDDEKVYFVISVEGDVKGFMGAIYKLGQDSYYSLKAVDAKGREKNHRFRLQNAMSFSINDQTYNGQLSSIQKTTAIKSYPTQQMYRSAIEAEIAKKSVSSGTGFFISNDGYIITNNHVIENAQNGNIKITGVNGDYNRKYKAQVEVTDKQNDLAVLKIVNSYPAPSINVPYTFKYTTSSVGEDCFVLGYPLVSSMGKDIKLTNGIISSKTGYEGNIAQYQISAPVQPGNSGGPLFDKDGNVIGIVQAKHTQAENAGYAIKSNYIRNLVDLLPTSINYPLKNLLTGKDLTQQVELARKTVCMIIVNEQ